MRAADSEPIMNDIQRLWVVLAAAASGALLFAIAWARVSRARSWRLQEHFGPEYDRVVAELGDSAQAERVLEERERRVEHFRFRELTQLQRAQLATQWNGIQARFASEPAIAVTAANELINEVMRARGYPTLSFEQRVADLSVEHPLVVQHYRAAHELSGSVFNGAVDRERLRQALVHYRKLFTELLHEDRGIAAPPAPLRRDRAA
jgi:hypothetical protein